MSAQKPYLPVHLVKPFFDQATIEFAIVDPQHPPDRRSYAKGHIEIHHRPNGEYSFALHSPEIHFGAYTMNSLELTPEMLEHVFWDNASQTFVGTIPKGTLKIL